MKTEFPLNPALDFLQHLWQLNHALERTSRQMEQTLGISAQQRLFIRCLGKYPGMTGSQLASLLHLDRGTVSTALRRLEGKGLVTMRRDPRDGRRISLGLTAAGHALDQPAAATVEHAVERLLGQLGRSEVESVKAALRLLTAALNSALPTRGHQAGTPLFDAHGKGVVEQG